MSRTPAELSFLAPMLHQRHLTALAAEGVPPSLGKQIHYVQKQMSQSETADESEVSDAPPSGTANPAPSPTSCTDTQKIQLGDPPPLIL